MFSALLLASLLLPLLATAAADEPTEGFAHCRPGYYDHFDDCLQCPVDYYCPGWDGFSSPKRICPAGTTNRSPGMSRCAVQPGWYFTKDGFARLCDFNYYCPGGYSDPRHCPSDRPRSGLGAKSAAECRK